MHEEDASNRLLPPSSRHEHSSIARFPSPRRRDDPAPRAGANAPNREDHGVEPPCGNPTLGERTLDGARSASASSLTRLPLRRPGATDGGATSPRRCRPRAKLAIWLLTPSVALRACLPVSGKAASKRQDRFRRSLVNESSLRGPGRLPSKSASGSPLARTVRKPATDLPALPPASRLPTRFHRATFSRGLARPAVEFASSSLASAEGRTPLFDFCNRMTIYEHDCRSSEPRVPPWSRLQRQHLLSGSRARYRVAYRASQEVTGQGQAGFRRPCASVLDRSCTELHPNPIALGISRRLAGSGSAGVAKTRAILPKKRWHRRGRAPDRLRNGRDIRAASRALPRRRAQSAAPEMPSIAG